MAGEYQVALKHLDAAIEEARENSGMDEDVLARAMMYQVIERYKKTRSDSDIVGELEQYLRVIADQGDMVITRGS